MAYGVNFITGGTLSVTNEGGGSPGSNSIDGNTGSAWLTAAGAGVPQTWKYDLGAAVTKIARKLRIFPYHDGSGAAIRAFACEGSNDDSNWTTIHSGEVANANQWNEYLFANSVAYRYYRIRITSTWRGDGYVGFSETEQMEFTPDATPGGNFAFI